MDSSILRFLQSDARDIVAFWAAARSDCTLPHQRKIDPVALRSWIGDLSVMEVRDGPKRFFISLHGMNTIHHIGCSFHQKYLEDCVPAHATKHALEPYDLAIEHRRPIYCRMLPGGLTGSFTQFERLILPFGDDDGNVARFMIWVGPSERDALSKTSVYGNRCPNPSRSSSPADECTLLILDPDRLGASRALPQAGFHHSGPGGERQSLWKRLFSPQREHRPTA